MDLYKKFPKGKLRVFRARQHDIKEILNSAGQLGSPPAEAARANRMSPPGISMFYGAFDTETCKMEIIDKSKHDTVISIGQFTNLKDLTLIDFTKLKDIPSLFDLQNRKKRPIAKFIKGFIADLSIPVLPDERVHVDYIPTQVVTEYIKIIIGREKNVNGIVYDSVKKPGGKCVVLFFENNDCCDKHEIVDPRIEEIGNFLGLSNSIQPNRDIFSLMLDNKKIRIESI